MSGTLCPLSSVCICTVALTKYSLSTVNLVCVCVCVCVSDLICWLYVFVVCVWAQLFVCLSLCMSVCLCVFVCLFLCVLVQCFTAHVPDGKLAQRKIEPLLFCDCS